MERLTHKARYEAGYKLNKGVKEWQAADRLGAYENTGLTPEEIMELKESVQRLDKIFGDEITVDQVVDFFVDFYIAQGDPDRVEAAELLTNEEASRYRELKERDTAKAPIKERDRSGKEECGIID